VGRAGNGSARSRAPADSGRGRRTCWRRRYPGTGAFHSVRRSGGAEPVENDAVEWSTPAPGPTGRSACRPSARPGRTPAAAAATCSPRWPRR
jgi:hypothetical protein